MHVFLEVLARLGETRCACHLFHDFMLCAGSKVINLMGSNGTKAVAAALLGAQVTCVDISPANVQYGQQLAEAAGVDVELVVADVLALPDNIMEGAGVGDKLSSHNHHSRQMLCCKAHCWTHCCKTHVGSAGGSFWRLTVLLYWEQNPAT